MVSLRICPRVDITSLNFPFKYTDVQTFSLAPFLSDSVLERRGKREMDGRGWGGGRKVGLGRGGERTTINPLIGFF